MKKFTLLLSLFISAAAFGQKDFDFTFYTVHANFSNIKDSSSPAIMTLPRCVKKEAGVLKIISTANTGNTQTYTLQYQGMQTRSGSRQRYVYTTTTGEVIYINPMQNALEIIFKDSREHNYF